jgi:hypothetical protein
MAVSQEQLEAWWAGLTDADRTLLIDHAYEPTMNSKTLALVDTLAGLPRVRGSFGGAPFPERIPEPLRTFVKARRNERDAAKG